MPPRAASEEEVVMKKLLIAILMLAAFQSALSSNVKLPPITEDTLENGLVVVAIENHELPTVTMRLVIRSGSAFDPPARAGLANFTADILRTGTKTRSATQISEEIDFVGGSLGASADRDAINVSCGVLLKHLDVGLELLSDVILHPVFDTTEIERLRNQTISAIVQAKDDPNSLNAKGFNKLLFGDHPYGHPVVGTESSVSAITREDIARFYGDFFHPNNSFLVVAGDIRPQEILTKIGGAFAEWKQAEIPQLKVSPPPDPSGYTILLINKPDATQTQIRFGRFGITRQDPDFYPFMVMNYILGVGFTSRLTQDVRVKGGKTYDIRTQNEWNAMRGAYYCNTFTENDSTMSAINAALRVIRGMREAEVTDQEYTDAVNFYSGYYPMTLETPDQVAAEIIKVKLYGLPVSYIQDFTQNISKVTKADILRAAQKYIDPDNMVFCVVSNADDVADGLRKLGEVTIIGVDEP
jgi:zinc protease